jgi:two-component system sensor kinase FixL
MKILVIDDEESVRWSVRILLRRHGFAVLEAGDGEEGLRLARTGMPDLILCDVVMRRMDGLEVLKQLRSQPDTSVIPVILMTGVPERADVRTSMERGADDYLAKPFEQEALIAAIQARLERQRVIQAQARNNETKLLELLSATHDMIAIAELINGQLLYLNDAGRRMLGIKTKSISGLQLTDFVADTGSRLKEKITHAEQHGLWVGECGFIRRDGGAVPVSIQILLHRPQDGKPAYISIVARDITERKRVEAKLEETHNDLLKASRQAGMAEIATGVLHNVGNVLNSINVASSCIARSLKQSRAATLSKVAELLRDHVADLGAFLTSDPKGKQIPGYLAQLSQHLVSEQEVALKELAQLQKNIQHVKDIVTMQQDYAKISGASEMQNVAELLDDVLRLTVNGFSPKGIQIIKDLDDKLVLMLPRHQVLQILVNLIRNAKQACEGSNNPDKKIVIKVERADGNLRISVTDNGVGITPENLNRIFVHGFTTKKNGHGFGLHSSMQAAREMNGKLLVESKGPGEGSTFTLELPDLSTASPQN